MIIKYLRTPPETINTSEPASFCIISILLPKSAVIIKIKTPRYQAHTIAHANRREMCDHVLLLSVVFAQAARGAAVVSWLTGDQ